MAAVDISQTIRNLLLARVYVNRYLRDNSEHNEQYFREDLAATMDRAVLGAKSIQRVFGAPPIAEIPLIVTVDDRGRTRRFRLVFLIGIPLLIIVALALFHVLVRPLDVFWYIAMRRLGI